MKMFSYENFNRGRRVKKWWFERIISHIIWKSVRKHLLWLPIGLKHATTQHKPRYIYRYNKFTVMKGRTDCGGQCGDSFASLSLPFHLLRCGPKLGQWWDLRAPTHPDYLSINFEVIFPSSTRDQISHTDYLTPSGRIPRSTSPVTCDDVVDRGYDLNLLSPHRVELKVKKKKKSSFFSICHLLFGTATQFKSGFKVKEAMNINKI